MTVNHWVAGSSPAEAASIALVVKWYNIGFVIRGLQFDSVLGHQQKKGVEYASSIFSK